MDIRAGLQIDDSDAVIPWLASPEDVARITGADALTQVSREYYVTRCSVLGGMRISVGFHFRGGKLVEFELLRHLPIPLAESYAEFQDHLQSTFGPPHTTIEGDCGYNHCDWRFGRVRVTHYIFDRFGPEEHVRISM